MATSMGEVKYELGSQNEGVKQVNSLHYGDRKFYRLPQEAQSWIGAKKSQIKSESVEDFMSYIDDNVVGRDSKFDGPFGQRQVVYCDYTASGRSLEMIEDYIRKQVLPLYGNTHTTTTVTSLQTTLYRHEARDIIRNAVNAGEHDAVIFVGTGCTAAVHKLIHSLNLQSPPVVFVGPYEHHSNLLPWREIGADVVRIAEDKEGLVDLSSLEEGLKKWHQTGRQLIGCFSAASNVTGILTDDVKVTVMLHRYSALAFWDYATAGPYVDINMNPVITGTSQQSSGNKDAIFLSPHKFVGGVETPGILVAKKSLFKNPVPSGGGGGSVFFVSREDHRYLKQVEMREEGGTPSIVGAVRAGLVFQLKEAIGADTIMAREHELCRKALSKWTDCTNLILLGNTTVPRLPIFSFLIRHPTTGQFLHHNFVCAVLNDVFGLQARGGCACAGPYAQDLLGINEKLGKEIEAALLEDGRLDRVHLRRYTEYSEREILRPGFVRINLPYFMSEDCVDFVIQAVTMAAQHAWKLLPQYIFNPETSEWKQRGHQVFQDRRWLGSINYATGKLAYPEPTAKKTKGRLPTDYKDCLKLAEEIFERAEKVRVQLPDQTLLFDAKASELRWFMLPSEARDLLSSTSRLHLQDCTKKTPFEPVKYKESFDVDALESRHHNHEDSWKENLAEKERIKESCGDSTKTLDGSVLECTRIPNRAEAEDERECELSCAELFLKTVEEGFVGDSGDTDWPEPSSVINRTDDEVKGQREDMLEGVGSVPQTDSLPESVSDPDNATSHNSSSCIHDKFGIDTMTDHCRISNDRKNLAVVKNATKTRNTEVVKSLSTSTLVHHRPLTDNSSMDVSSTQTNDASDNTALALASEKLHHKPHIPSPESNRAVSNLDKPEGQNAGSKHLAEVHHDPSMDKSLESADNEPAGFDATLSLTKEQNTSQVGSVETQRTKTGAPLKTESGKSGMSRNRSGFQKPPKNIFKPTVQALEEYKMIEDGDHVLVCLSGGKDSLSLLHTLRQYQFYAKSKGISFEIGGVTVDPQTLAYDPRPLIPYLASLRVPYFYEEQCIIDTASSLEGGCDSICSFCSRMKRGRLYACARREGYNVLAMGQHLDDLAESFLMSIFHNGLLRTMKANYTVKEGDLRVIRPFVYTRERDLRDFAEKAKLPVIPENCPACFEAPKERHRTKQLLASQELLFPRLYNSLQAAMKPMMAKNRTGMESSRTKEDFFQDGEM